MSEEINLDDEIDNLDDDNLFGNYRELRIAELKKQYDLYFLLFSQKWILITHLPQSTTVKSS